MDKKLHQLQQQIDGELFTSSLYKKMYATDASVYREYPLAVCIPRHKRDVIKLIEFCHQNKIGIIPRAAGTSLAGQCVGNGIVVDISKNFTHIISLDKENKTVTVEPGVIRDELNLYLKEFALFFGPNTSTSNRCMLGGMVGNNSSGSTSIQYGVTRDKVIEIEAILSDGSEVVFKPLTQAEFQKKQELNTLEGEIYRFFASTFSEKENRSLIIENFPDVNIHRRNTGYALDKLIDNDFFEAHDNETFNLCKLIAGSEGTLAFITQIKLQLEALPPTEAVMIAAHFHSIEDCLNAVVPTMQHDLYACEMMDETILDCTKTNLKYAESRFFIQEDPVAILLLELRANTHSVLSEKITALQQELGENTSSYANVVLQDEEIEMAVELRKAGLGLLGNIKGDKKTLACIEDTAVKIEDLASYIQEFTALMARYQQKAVYYAHAGAGELHLRPILNLKKSEEVALFKQITLEVAKLVKKYKGAFSGEHGDGRVRAAFIKMLVGEEVYKLFIKTKSVFDPDHIFNPGKIVSAKPIDEDLRYVADREEPVIKTLMNFDDSFGFLRAIENCNGSGDCRKTELSSGVMCPSYHVTKNEKDTTRGRANVLREMLTNNRNLNQFDDKEAIEVLDLCVGCKACKSECPSNIDMATYKAETLYQYYQHHKRKRSDYLFGNANKINQLASILPNFTNRLYKNPTAAKLIKRLSGIAPERSLPLVSRKSLTKQLKVLLAENNQPQKPIKEVYLFVDEFTDTLDTQIGLEAIKLLQKLNYRVSYLPHQESGRAFISKGFLEQAQQVANQNIEAFKDVVTAETPLIGIEPSAILSFRDEYLRLANDINSAKAIAQNTFLIEEFLAKEIALENIKSSQFSEDTRVIKIHPHCHQKSLSHSKHTFDILNLPKNHQVTVINAGCCGMAGSFGYKKEHYKVSMQMGDLRLFPSIKKTKATTEVVANGTSCRHQIYDGTGRIALHPVQILYQSLI
ncbi:FAD-binding and (Fe-S)-binding domain-containing protein [Mesonia sp. K7]|uniref:FAD-binding and (Fe-S)-binding domain-containing protein n=1 Tax=Mesonia sp. K7 TaxID=2218606 RepID=UPI000DA9BC3B|nr:FAD-binding and (Fe-S)-binding domain-containing protein [Mesonia sp. K7]PZD76466.1 FAD-binding oxidoreductase [Mesonia sp. K7]